MSFQMDTVSQNIEMLKNTIIQIAKYSSGDIIITDEKFNVIFQNAQYIENKLSLFDIINELLNEDFRIKLNNFKTSENNHLFIKMLLISTKHDANTPIDIHFCKIKNSKDKIKGYVVILKDVLQEIRNRIQKETFIDIITHDLKNPMRANIQILELILNNKYGKVDGKLKIVLDELLNSCKFMKYMADNLIIKYKNEFDVFELHKQKYSIIKLIKDKCANINKILDRKNQTVEIIINSEIPDVFIDIDEMKKVIRNLIINASNESRENSKIIIKIDCDYKNVFVSILDWGYSSNKAVLDNLFDEYIACSNKFRKIGFSLEMFNCRKIIEAHGGSISAQNSNINGKNITFSLPVFDVNLKKF